MQKVQQQCQKMLAHRAQLNFQTANIRKAALKLEAAMTNAATYYFSSIKGNPYILLVRLSINSPPATLQSRNKMLIQSHRLARKQSQSSKQLLTV